MPHNSSSLEPAKFIPIIIKKLLLSFNKAKSSLFTWCYTTVWRNSAIKAAKTENLQGSRCARIIPYLPYSLVAKMFVVALQNQQVDNIKFLIDQRNDIGSNLKDYRDFVLGIEQELGGIIDQANTYYFKDLLCDGELLGKPDFLQNMHNRALVTGINSNNINMVEALLRYYLSIEEKGRLDFKKLFNSAFMAAITRNKLNMLEALLNYKPKVKHQEEKIQGFLTEGIFMYAMQVAINRGNIDMCITFLNYCVSIKKVFFIEEQFKHRLLEAIQQNNTSIFKKLLDYCASVPYPQRIFLTESIFKAAVPAAVQQNNFNMVEAILNYCCSPEQQGKFLDFFKFLNEEVYAGYEVVRTLLLSREDRQEEVRFSEQPHLSVNPIILTERNNCASTVAITTRP